MISSILSHFSWNKFQNNSPAPNNANQPAMHSRYEHMSRNYESMQAIANGLLNKIQGNSGSEVLIGGFKNDYINGQKGNDLIAGIGGNDIIKGGAGDDIILAGAGNDRLHGNRGNDLIYGGAGHDTINGGKGNDILLGGTENCLLYTSPSPRD